MTKIPARLHHDPGANPGGIRPMDEWGEPPADFVSKSLLGEILSMYKGAANHPNGLPADWWKPVCEALCGDLSDERDVDQSDATIALHLWRALRGESLPAPLDTALRDLLATKGKSLVPLTMLDAIRHFGIDPARAIAFTMAFPRFAFWPEGGNAGREVKFTDSRCWAGGIGISVVLDPTLGLTGESTVLTIGIPHTVLHASVGRRLSEIVSHPTLDRHEMRIRDWQSPSGDVSGFAEIVVHPPGFLRLKDLLATWSPTSPPPPAV